MEVSVTPERMARVQAAVASRLGSVVAVAESVRRRHNTSAILRSCESFGVHEVHLITGEFQAASGASRGSERWVNLRSFAKVEESLEELKGRGFRILVADFIQPCWSPDEAPMDKPIAVVFGSEVRGVSEAARRYADGAITIPTYGLTQSLNVSVSAAIILQRLTERRRAMSGPDLDPAEKERFVAEWLDRETTSRRGWERRTG